MTVSAVLHGGRSGTRVSDTTRARVQEVAARLRYRRNAVARGLSVRRMDTIGVAAIVGSGEVNLYFLEVLEGILEAAGLKDKTHQSFPCRIGSVTSGGSWSSAMGASTASFASRQN